MPAPELTDALAANARLARELENTRAAQAELARLRAEKNTRDEGRENFILDQSAEIARLTKLGRDLDAAAGCR